MASNNQLDLNNKNQNALPRLIQTLQEISAIDATKQSSQATILNRKKSLSSGKITASSCDTVIVPIVIEDFVMMEGLIVSVGFDSTWIDINASLTDSVLSSQNYIMSQNMLENKFNCWIYAISNPVSNSGTVAFLHIDIQGYDGQTTQLNMNGLYCNSVPVRGGFMLNNSIYQHIEITIENNQFYNIETNVAYNGSLTGVLHALATQMDDTSIIMAQNHVRWLNDQPVKLEVKKGTYQLTGFIFGF
jgi:hypothetical protein